MPGGWGWPDLIGFYGIMLVSGIAAGVLLADLAASL